MDPQLVMNDLPISHKIIIAFLLILVIYYHNKNIDPIHKPVPVVEPDNNPDPVVPTPKPEPKPEPVPQPEKNCCDSYKEKASKHNKKLLIIFSAKWCGYCRSLKKDLDSLVDKNKYEICLVDVDDKSLKDFIKPYNIKSLPTSVIVDPKNNTETKRVEGYDKNNYVNWLKG